jgi:hypothetical protein
LNNQTLLLYARTPNTPNAHGRRKLFEAFAVDDPTRRNTAGIWRFNRSSGEGKVVGVRDSEVHKDIYTVYNEDGKPNTGIETLLCKIESAFGDARRFLLDKQNILEKQVKLSKEHWTGLARFVAAQLLRTPRFFEMMRTYLTVNGLAYEIDTPPQVMVILIERWITRLVRMRGMLVYTETDLPFLTSDNPAVMWKKQGDGFICGVDQYDRELVVSCPLSPTLLYVAYQTEDSLKAVHAERHDIPRDQREPELFLSHVDFGSIPEWEVKRQNQLCLQNAHKNVYANYCDKPLLKLLQNRFFSNTVSPGE